MLPTVYRIQSVDNFGKDLINIVAGKLSRGFSMASKPKKYVHKSALINQFLVYLL